MNSHMFSARTLSQLEINCQNVEHSFIVFIMINNNNHNIPKIATPPFKQSQVISEIYTKFWVPVLKIVQDLTFQSNLSQFFNSFAKMFYM